MLKTTIFLLLLVLSCSNNKTADVAKRQIALERQAILEIKDYKRRIFLEARLRCAARYYWFYAEIMKKDDFYTFLHYTNVMEVCTKKVREYSNAE